MKESARMTAVLLTLAMFVVIPTVYLYSIEGSRRSTEGYILWIVYLLLLVIIGVFVLTPASRGLNTVTERVPPRI